MRKDNLGKIAVRGACQTGSLCGQGKRRPAPCTAPSFPTLGGANADQGEDGSRRGAEAQRIQIRSLISLLVPPSLRLCVSARDLRLEFFDAHQLLWSWRLASALAALILRAQRPRRLTIT